MIVMAWGFWIFSVAAAVFFTGSTINSGGTNFGGAVAFAIAELVFILSGLLFYVWYRNAYVEITRSYVRRRNLFRLVEELEYRHISGYGYHDEPNGAIDTDGLYLNGPEDEEGFPTLGVQLHGVWANYDYVLGQIAFRILNERWAEPESDEDQNLIQEYISSGRAREICLEQSGFVFPENDNSPYPESKE
ncbi:hypothetical protein [Rothia dentocariosa]|uniref:hypothetical protein n=1 Tax=Rothia dentocariosa TaxID=2047 RepID=UPI0028ED3384|nr:hypothetical protein [Rothia dentocariosa]